VSLRLTQANLNNDVAALDECVKLLEPVRSAWLAIGPAAPATETE
jgi:flagellar protein FliS